MRNKSLCFGGSVSFLAVLLAGCRGVLLFAPKGPIGDTELTLMIAAMSIMLAIVLVVFVLHVWFTLTYRASNKKATYMPKWHYSLKLDLVIWVVPLLIVGLLAYLSWTRTHWIDPYKPIGQEKPLRVQAISLDWKYLFIYPDQGVASVNEVVFPAHVPVAFELTSGTVMTSFFIPQLGSQIYAMAAMRTRLHLLADAPGTYIGHNQHFSGKYYADMHFKAIATASRAEFEDWLNKARQSAEKLDLTHYQKLTEPTAGYPVTYYSAVMPGLFEHIMRSYNSGWGKSHGSADTEHAFTPMPAAQSKRQ